MISEKVSIYLLQTNRNLQFTALAQHQAGQLLSRMNHFGSVVLCFIVFTTIVIGNGVTASAHEPYEKLMAVLVDASGEHFNVVKRYEDGIYD